MVAYSVLQHVSRTDSLISFNILQSLPQNKRKYHVERQNDSASSIVNDDVDNDNNKQSCTVPIDNANEMQNKRRRKTKKNSR